MLSLQNFDWWIGIGAEISLFQLTHLFISDDYLSWMIDVFIVLFHKKSMKENSNVQ